MLDFDWENLQREPNDPAYSLSHHSLPVYLVQQKTPSEPQDIS